MQGDAETPAQRRARLLEEKQQDAVASLRSDAGALALIEAFDASIELDSVEPLPASGGEQDSTSA
ncbi:MAG: hypothetical protein EX270_02140 [Pseudomonadales bacterium]|nr:MAG: hypothetical protein EX270_02140 [Pseudomonadales bacterium]